MMHTYIDPSKLRSYIETSTFMGAFKNGTGCKIESIYCDAESQNLTIFMSYYKYNYYYYFGVKLIEDYLENDILHYKFLFYRPNVCGERERYITACLIKQLFATADLSAIFTYLLSQATRMYINVIDDVYIE